MKACHFDFTLIFELIAYNVVSICVTYKGQYRGVESMDSRARPVPSPNWLCDFEQVP